MSRIGCGLVLAALVLAGCGSSDEDKTDKAKQEIEEARTALEELNEEVEDVGSIGDPDSLDSESIENDAREGFEAAGVTVEDVACPSSGVTGTTIECRVTLEGGEIVSLPYKVNEESVDATDETIEVIQDVAAKQGE